MDLIIENDVYIKNLQKIANDILLLAIKKGASQASVSINSGIGMELSVRMQKIETIQYQKDQILVLTVYFGKKKGSISITDININSLKKALYIACKIAKFTEKDNFCGLPKSNELAKIWPNLDIFYPWNLSVKKGIKILMDCEKIAIDKNRKICNSNGAILNTYNNISILANTYGFNHAFTSSLYSISLGLIAEENNIIEQDYEYTTARSHLDLWPIEKIANFAVKKTIAKLNAKSVGTKKVPIIFSAFTAISLIDHFIKAISGENLYQKISFLKDAINTMIFPEWFEIIEDPFIPKGIGTTPYDMEGVKLKQRKIVENGFLKEFILDTYSARKLGLQTTGNSGGIHNLIIKYNHTGGISSLIKDIDYGLIITELMGSGANILNGDYSRGAKGFWIKNGEILHAVNEVTIAGKLQNIFKNIQYISNDIEMRSSIRTGSIMIKEMTISSS